MLGSDSPLLVVPGLLLYSTVAEFLFASKPVTAFSFKVAV